jgi:adenylate cyclase
MDAGENGEDQKLNRRRFETLSTIVSAINSTLNIEVVLQIIMDNAIELMGAERGFIMMIDPTTYRLEFRVARNIDRKSLKSEELEISRSIVRQVFEKKTAALTHNAGDDPRYKDKPSVRKFDLRSVIAVPLLVKGKCVGVIYLDNKYKLSIFNDDDLDFMKLFAHQVALAMENARLEEEKALIKKLFTNYVSPEVVEEILERGGEFDLRGEKRVVTTFFSDIRGFTTLTETLPPSDLILQLLDYRQEMVDILFNFRGTLIKLLGDGIMGVFGAPLGDADDAERAVKAGIEMVDMSDKLNGMWKEVGMPEFRIGIGMDTGEALVGVMGCHERREYDVLGDVVNTASRLESLNKEFGSAFLITEATYRCVKHFITCEDMGEVAIRGKSEKIRVYKVR